MCSLYGVGTGGTVTGVGEVFERAPALAVEAQRALWVPVLSQGRAGSHRLQESVPVLRPGCSIKVLLMRSSP